jgi:hypothetical protein
MACRERCRRFVPGRLIAFAAPPVNAHQGLACRAVSRALLIERLPALLRRAAASRAEGFGARMSADVIGRYFMTDSLSGTATTSEAKQIDTRAQDRQGGWLRHRGERNAADEGVRGRCCQHAERFSARLRGRNV